MLFCWYCRIIYHTSSNVDILNILCLIVEVERLWSAGSRLSMARRQWLWKLCPWARLIMIHVIQWWQHTSLVFSILLMYTVHTLHCQPRASPTETMENETHNPHICSNTIINTPQFCKRNMREPQHWWGLWRNAELTEVFTFVLTSHLHRYLLCTV